MYCLIEVSAVSLLVAEILPGGSKQGAFFHYARSVCRRAERSVFTLEKEEKENISPLIGKYLNRLSDLFFIYARFINHETHIQTHIPERLWQKQTDN